ncbi:MAG: hypothetical protein ACI8XM_000254 [Haloarculaceae archaeon]|jgi:hypothetical protein
MTVLCLGCGTESTDFREHNRHVKRADHPDEGEAYR